MWEWRTEEESDRNRSGGHNRREVLDKERWRKSGEDTAGEKT